MPRRLLREPLRPNLWENLVIILTLGGAALASQQFYTLVGEGVPLLWLPSGLALGFLLRSRFRAVPGILLGLLLATLLTHKTSLSTELLRAYAECFFALVLLRRRYFDPEFSKAGDVAIFTTNGVVLTPLVATAAYALALQVIGAPLELNNTHTYLDLAARMASIGLCVPAITLFNSREWLEMPHATRWKLIAFLLLGPAAVELELLSTFHSNARAYPFALLPFPLISWIVIGISVSAAMQFLLVMSLILIASTARGAGYFASNDAIFSVITQDGFISLLCLSTLTMGTLLRHRQRIENLSSNALRGARVAIWEWLPGTGLVLHDREWAQHFRGQAGKPIRPAFVEREIEAEHPVSILCGPFEMPLLKVNEEERFRLRLPDGQWRSLLCRRLPAPPASSALRDSLSGILVDLTEAKEAEALRQTTLLREAELKNLKLSIHPHFLFNSLNSLRSLISSRPNEARECVTRLAAFLRSSLGAADENLVRFKAEVELVNNYLSIEQLRFGTRLRQVIQIDAACETVPFPPMLLQTLVENGIKYGVARRMDGGELRIEGEISNGNLLVRVINEGALIPTPVQATGTGIPAANQRLLLLFGSKAGVTLKQIDGPRVQAEITIPCTVGQSTGARAPMKLSEPILSLPSNPRSELKRSEFREPLPSSIEGK